MVIHKWLIFLFLILLTNHSNQHRKHLFLYYVFIFWVKSHNKNISVISLSSVYTVRSFIVYRIIYRNETKVHKMESMCSISWTFYFFCIVWILDTTSGIIYLFLCFSQLENNHFTENKTKSFNIFYRCFSIDLWLYCA